MKKHFTEIPKRSVGYVWVGAYQGGHLGWHLPTFMTPNGTESLSTKQREVLDQAWSGYPSHFYRAKITLTPVRNKRGRYIVKRNSRGII